MSANEQIKSKDWCPTCLLQNKVQNVLMNRAGQFYTNCAAGHQFSDTEELNVLRSQARAKYPQLYQVAAPSPVDPSVLASQDIVVNAEVKRAIEEIAGQQITSGGDLKGLMYAYIQDNKDKDAELKSVRAAMATMGRRSQLAPGMAQAGLQPGQFMVQIPEWAMAGVASQSEYAGKTPEEWVSEEFSNYFEAYFGAPAAR